MSIFFSGCAYKVKVKAGFEKKDEMFIGTSEWPVDPIKIHIWKKDDIGYKCNGVFTKGYTSGGTINNGRFNLVCVDGKRIKGNWYSPSGQNNLIGKGEDEKGNAFHLIAGTQLNQFPNLEYNLKRKIAKKPQRSKKKIKKTKRRVQSTTNTFQKSMKSVSF